MEQYSLFLFWNNSYTGTQNVMSVNLWKGSVREKEEAKTEELKKIPKNIIHKEMSKESHTHKGEIYGWVDEVIKNCL